MKPAVTFHQTKPTVDVGKSPSRRRIKADITSENQMFKPSCVLEYTVSVTPMSGNHINHVNTPETHTDSRVFISHTLITHTNTR